MINIKFKDKTLLELALTHRSWVNENIGKRRSNERLEFLGDAILEFVVTDHLYNELPDKEEGYLTDLRANIVNTVNLAKLAKELDISKYLFVSKGILKAGKVNDSILADTIESLIGAIYLDSGIKAAEDFIVENLLSDLDKKIGESLKDPKSSLQESVQAKGMFAPKYRLVNIKGPDHEKMFTVEVLVEGKVMGVGTGHNKSEAQQKAASLALKALSV